MDIQKVSRTTQSTILKEADQDHMDYPVPEFTTYVDVNITLILIQYGLHITSIAKLLSLPVGSF